MGSQEGVKVPYFETKSPKISFYRRICRIKGVMKTRYWLWTLTLILILPLEALSWAPSAQNCTDTAILKEAEDRADDRDHMFTDDPNRSKNTDDDDQWFGKSEEEKKLEWITDERGRLDARCDKFEDKQMAAKEKQEDLKREQIEKREQAQKEAQDKKEQAKREQQNKCDKAHQDYLSSRKRIEGEVRGKEEAKDEIEDEIRQNDVKLSKKIDEYNEKIDQHKQRRRAEENRLQGESDQRSMQFTRRLSQINNALSSQYQMLERLEHQKQMAHEKRYQDYLEEYAKCHSLATAQIEQERDQRITYARKKEGYKIDDVEKLFLNDPKTVESNYIERFHLLRTNCFEKAVGLKSLNEVQFKKEVESSHPTSIKIETLFKTSLKNIEFQKKQLKEKMAQLSKQIEELNTENNQFLDRFKQRSADMETAFNENLENLEKRIEKERASTQANKLKLLQKIVRIDDSDPRRHFVEELESMSYNCCRNEALGGDSFKCRQLNTYASDLRKIKFVNIKPSLASQMQGAAPARAPSSRGAK